MDKTGSEIYPIACSGSSSVITLVFHCHIS